MKVDILNLVDTVDMGVKKLKPLLKDYIQNKSFPLSARWEVYSTVPSYFFDTDYCYALYTFGGDEICWSDAPHYIENRGKVVDNVDVIRRYENSDVTSDNIDDLKEQMLASGFRKWHNDW